VLAQLQAVMENKVVVVAVGISVLCGLQPEIWQGRTGSVEPLLAVYVDEKS
jgi:hypothetical protein